MISPLCSNALKRSQRGKSTEIHKLTETIETEEISNPQSCFTSPHLICLAHLRAFSCRTTVLYVTGMSPMGYFLFCFCSILPWKSFVKGNVSPTYLDDVLSKSEQKRSLKAKEEEWRSEHSTSSGWFGGGGSRSVEDRSGKVAKDLWWWAGALIAKDNGNMKKKGWWFKSLYYPFPELWPCWDTEDMIKGQQRSWEGKAKYDIVYVGQRGWSNWGKTNYNRWTLNQYLANRKGLETTSKLILRQEGFTEKTYWTDGCTDVTLSSEVWWTRMMLLFQCLHLYIGARTFLNVIFGIMINK